MQQVDAAAEQEALFQAIIRKLPAVEDPAQLAELGHAALALMLRRPGDRALREELTRQIDAALAPVHPGLAGEARRTAMRCAARACVRVLRSARERRLSRADEARHGAASHPPHHHAAPHAAVSSGAQRNAARALWIGAALVALVGAGLWGMALRPKPPDLSALALRLVEQMAAAAEGGPAAEGAAPAQHVFGGALRVEGAAPAPLVVAEGVPPPACVSAGWALVRKGVLTINGVTPNRVSAIRVTELCNQGDGDATIAWMPK